MPSFFDLKDGEKTQPFIAGPSSSAGTFLPTGCHSVSGYSFPTYPAPVLAQESQNSLCLQQHRHVRGYINLSLLTLLGWQWWRTETKSLHNQRPQQFPQMCETPSVFRIVCVPREPNTANFAISDSGQGREKATPRDQRGVILRLFILCPARSSPHHFSLRVA